MILFVTDSLGGPRFAPEPLYYQETWVYGIKRQLKLMGLETHSIVHNGLDSCEIRNNLLRFIPFYKPELVIYQVGICDCAPRTISAAELRYLMLLPDRFQSVIKSWLRRYFDKISTARNICNVDLVFFTANIKYISEQFESIFIPIAPVCEGYTKVAPRISQNVAAYNAVLRKYSTIWLESFENTPQSLVNKMFAADHHHLNQEGQKHLVNCILSNPSMMERIQRLRVTS